MAEHVRLEYEQGQYVLTIWKRNRCQYALALTPEQVIDLMIACGFAVGRVRQDDEGQDAAGENGHG